VVFEETNLTVSAGIAPNKVLFLLFMVSSVILLVSSLVDARKGEASWNRYKDPVSNFLRRRFVQTRSAS
jgi:hypothetical protein